MSQERRVAVSALTDFVASLFEGVGVSANASRRMALALVEADVSGKRSHGVLQAIGYLDRMLAGGMTTAEHPKIVQDRDAAIVLDAGNMLGHLAAEDAVEIGVSRAKKLGLAAVAMRHGNHFGVAGRYVRMATEKGCAAIVMNNSRPVAVAPGGAQKLVGTNPLAMGIPTAGQPPIILDMATTEGTVGRIRYAAAAGQSVPDNWAVDADGNSTTDPNAALKGMLLSAAGPKGFGIAVIADLMSGLLSSGQWGDGVFEMRGDPQTPANISSIFIFLNIEHFRPLTEFLKEAQHGADRIRTSTPAPGTDRVVTPGQLSHETTQSNDGTLSLAASLATEFSRLAGELNVALPDWLKT